MHFLLATVAVLLGTATAVAHAASLPVVVGPGDGRLRYEGRWAVTYDNDGQLNYNADWPCSALSFTVQTPAAAANTTFNVSVLWLAARVRVNVTVHREATGATVWNDTLYGPWVVLPIGPIPIKQTAIPIPPSATGTRFVVTLRKLTTAFPFGAGIGAELLPPSVVNWYGLGPFQGLPNATDATGVVVPLAKKTRRYEAIGASDTAGYCVDGNGTGIPYLTGWEYVNCDMAYPQRLADKFGAAVSVQAISGTGMVQNAAAKDPWQMGTVPLPGYFNRTLQSSQWGNYAPNPFNVWNFSGVVDRGNAPDLVTVSLGGNDYNHQHGDVPSNATFTAHYDAFLTKITKEFYPTDATKAIVAVCGMGDPIERKKFPDNNRCRPCPFVEQAVAAFKADPANAVVQAKVHYMFVPCDGSVVTGEGDIGCDGHKNRVGQAEVADFMAPRIAAIMGW